MARISTYPIISTPAVDDLLIGTDVNDLNITKNFTIGEIGDLIGQDYVPYVGATGNVNLGSFNITAGGFIVGGGTAGQFLKANGTLDSTVYVPSTRTLTINGTTYNLSANRSWDLNTIDTLTTTGTSGAATYIGRVLNIPVYQAQGAYITQLSGEATAVGPGNATVTLSNSAVISKVLTGLNVTGGTVVSTDSILQAFGKVQNQINGLTTGVTYQGVWNAATNVPFLQSSVGTKGYYYVVDVAGSTNLNGITDWKVGDWAIYNGTAWEKVDNTDAVVSVNGYVGAVVLTSSDVGAVPTTRTITINGVGYNLSADRAWTVGDVRTDQSYINPSWITSLAWSKITGTPTTLAGYGITDGALNTRTLTINGTTYDLTANRTWSVGTVTSVGTSGPLTGGTITGSGTIGITQSGASSDGYLSSADWNAFNSKQEVISVNAPLTFAAGVIGITQSSSTVNGYLSSTDWTTFNNKVGGSGTANTLPMWGSASSLVNSPLSYAADTFNFQYNSATGGTVNFTNTGLTTYTYSIQMNNFGSPRSTVHSYTDGLVIQSIGGTQVSRMFANGNLILGTGTVDNGYKLEITGNLYVNSIANATTDTDRFIVSDGGVIKYRTGAEVLSDIGAQGSLTLTTTGSSGASTLIGNTLNIPDYGSALTGYVPYTGANQTVNLNTQQLVAGHATFTTNGSTDTLTINHTSGSGRGIVVTKSGSGQGLTVVKSSGSGNVASITGGITLISELNLTTDLADTYIASAANWNTAYNNRITSLTTTGTSGAATLVSHVLNIPQYQAQGNYITSLTGEATASGPGAASVTLTNSAVTGKVLTGLTVTGTSISATDSILTAFGKLQGQVNDLVGGLKYDGTWNASTNTPTITSGVGTSGEFYIVNVAGNTTIDGISGWQIGDWIVFDGTAWQKVDNTESVVSVNGFTGAVTLTTSNISEGTNLYFTNSRARQAISLTTTGNSGASTYDNGTGVLNVPQYTLAGLGGVPTTRSLTINGTAFDLSADRTWNVGTVTSIATSGPLTGGTITGSGTIGITQSSSTSNGFLSSTDWNTFNNKQNALTNPVTGIGTTNTIPRFTGASTIGDSSIQDNTNEVSISKRLFLSTGGQSILLTPNLGGVSNRIETSALPLEITTTGSAVRLAAGGVTAQLTLASSGVVTLTNLAGTGTRIVTADASGNLSASSALSGYIQGSGTTNYLPKFTGSTTIGNSIMQESGAAIQVSGNVQVRGDWSSTFSVYQLLDTRVGGAEWNIENGRTIGNLEFYNGAAGGTKLTLTPVGNLGLAVTPPSWSTFKAINIFGGSFSTNSLVGGGVVIARNWYFDGGERYYENGTAQRFELVSNGFFFQTATTNSSGAGAALTWGSPMTLNSSGNLLLGTETDNGARLQVSGPATVSGIITTTSTSLASGNFGGNASSWAGNVNYPTLFGSSVDRWIMHINPHISYTQNGVNGFTGSMTGSTLRFASNPAADSYWDIGVGTNSSGTDKLSIGRAGTNYLSVTSTGNVGIGTLTPGQKLQIGNGTETGNHYLRIFGAATDIYFGQTGSNLFGAGNGQVLVTDSTYTGPLAIGTLSGNANATLIFGTSNTEAMRIFSSRNVHIGSTPVSDNGARLQVSGTATFSSTVTSAGFIIGGDQLYRMNGYNSGYSYMNTNAGFSSIYNGVGIFSNATNANSLPAWVLDLGGLDGPSWGGVTDGLTISRKASGGSWANFFRITSTGAATFSSSVTAGGRIIATGGGSNGVLVSSNSGSVTIPTTGLSLNTGFNVGYLQNFNGGNYVDLYYGASKHIFDGGNVGIGTTSPTNYTGYRTLSVNNTSGGVLELKVNDVSALNIFSDSAQSYLYEGRNLPIDFYTNTLNRMRISAGGNLLVGTTTDNGARLQVSGAATITGSTNQQLVLDFTTASGGFTWQSFRLNGTNRYRIFGNTDNSFTLYSDILSANVLSITSGGNVLIGTTTDNASRLQVSGNVHITNSNPCVIVADGTNTSFFATASSGGSFGVGVVAGDAVVRGLNGVSLVPANGANAALRIASSSDATFSNNLTASRYFNPGGPYGTDQGNARNHFTQFNAGNATLAGGWISGAFGDALGNRIVIGQYQGVAVIAGHNGNLDNWASMALATGGGNVMIGSITDVGAKLYVEGAIRTGAPSGGSAVNWRLGTARGGPVTSNATVRVEIDGVLVDLVARYV